VERRFLLDVVIRKSESILELLTGKDQTLLIRRDSFLVLNPGQQLAQSTFDPDAITALTGKGGDPRA
jgi:hypothetical protein